jgi:hypothetical protein
MPSFKLRGIEENFELTSTEGRWHPECSITLVGDVMTLSHWSSD